MAYKLTYKRFGEQSILVEWPAFIDENTLFDVLKFKEKIFLKKNKSIISVNNAYNSLLINYISLDEVLIKEIDILKSIYNSNEKTIKKPSRLWIIPACYDDAFGIDLELISKEKNISKSTIIKLHTAPIYIVYFIGFLPGFLYLGGLDNQLKTPRKATPRLQIKKGAVAIGGSQTGVYPSESPGGWNIIGNSPIAFFNPEKTPPCFVNAGDRLVFKAITIEEYKDIKILSEAGVYQLESQEIYD